MIFFIFPLPKCLLWQLVKFVCILSNLFHSLSPFLSFCFNSPDLGTISEYFGGSSMGKADSLSGGAEACSNVAAVIDAMAILQLFQS